MDKFSLIRGIIYVLFGIIIAVVAAFVDEVAAQMISIVFTMLGVNDICEAFIYGDDDEE